MDVVLFGPPGAGKGTQADHISSLLGITHISTGDLFRNLDKSSELGLRVKAIMDAGQLVPDDVTMEILAQRLGQDDVESGVLLDGFPRTTNQAEALMKWMTPRNRSVDLVLAINITDEEVHRRLVNRRMCRSCGASYHLIFVPTKEEGICDACGGELYQRGSDTAAKVQPRIDGYHEWTLPMLSYLEKQGFTVVNIDGMQKPSVVTESITDTLKSHGFSKI
jgi:adenylate kinase